MKLTGILPLLAEDAAVPAAVAALPAGGRLELVAPAGARASVLAELALAACGGSDEPGAGGGSGAKARQLVVVTATTRDADELAAALRAFVPADDVAVLPAWETLPHERLSPRADTVARRLAVFRRLAHPETDRHTDGQVAATSATQDPAAKTDAGPTKASRAKTSATPTASDAVGHAHDARAQAGPIRVLVVPARALLQPVTRGLGDLEPVSARAGETHSIETLVEQLVAAAYTRVDMVEKRGDFAVRGGILDVFPPTEDHPLRLDFWGDEIEEIRWFAVADQRSLEIAPEGLWAPPCRELLLTPDVRRRALALRDALPGATDMLEKMAEGIAVEGMESLIPALVDDMDQVLRLVDPDARLILVDPERIRRRAHDLVATTSEFLAAAWTSAAAGGSVPLDLSAASFVTLEEARDVAARRGLGWWTLTPFGGDEELAALTDLLPDEPADDGEDAFSGPVTTLRLGARDVEGYRGDLARAITDLQQLTHDGWRLVLVTEGAGPARRLVEQLKGADVPARLVADLEEVPEPGLVHVTTAQFGRGYVLPALRFAIFTEADLTGRAGASTKDMRQLAPRRRNVVDPLALRAGDYVVHEQHGVGRFIELVQRSVGGGPGASGTATTREYLVIEYASSKRGQPGDRLYVPTDALDQVTKYTGGESPSLSKMGGSDWQNTKARARKAVKEIAGELVRLYAARMATQGHAFGPDTPWQRELEDAFAYVETPDQLVTIDDVKRDMEKTVPMDRLICGDVGYGKTEVAVRAAFKAVQDGKQVAVLVPTTLLVQQHLQTFAERYAGFPVNVAGLSRFQTDAEARLVREGVADGTVDVVIGTHRLITGEVRFKDLGLVIIDEEQRFGVEHKETLTQLRTNVDVLAMSATPIPRTLEMAVTGIREMSTLATPPEERHPVLTFVGPYEEKQITAAIRRELLRDGQVFFVHNRVESIERTASRLAELVPEARIAVAHGKMNEHQLERVIVDFWEKRSDVLVCTTIVETGLDISNANTLILDRADVLGLSQLHQLRGRVGRGRERAYAYFLYPPEKPLTETAHDRLATIAANTDLGAGMQVALKDLEIRGAGNLLGGEQSGHIAGVGFDLYVRMVSEAVQRYRGEEVAELADVTIELPIDAHIPHDYVPHERLRLEAYTKIASAAGPDDVAAVREELTDRYGPVPRSVELLFAVANLRTVAREVGVTAVTIQGQFIRFAPVDLTDSMTVRLKRLYPRSIIKGAVRTILVPAPTTARVGGEMVRDGELLDWVLGVLRGVVGGSVAAAAASVGAS
ncbi:transcription-repair coupling factor [Miniimonas sp. S16]|uniref:transcription-repair coupling factor n=1 Tax=Miniimonas sp. S16 TaxID=2171623 RepID=UPI001F392CF4|nr:transcription-repair coupling factor [Miniimonas sp. S16]